MFVNAINMSDTMWVPWRRKSPATPLLFEQLAEQQWKQQSSILLAFFVWEVTVDRWIPSQMASDTGKVSM